MANLGADLFKNLGKGLSCRKPNQNGFLQADLCFFASSSDVRPGRGPELRYGLPELPIDYLPSPLSSMPFRLFLSTLGSYSSQRLLLQEGRVKKGPVLTWPPHTSEFAAERPSRETSSTGSHPRSPNSPVPS